MEEKQTLKRKAECIVEIGSQEVLVEEEIPEPPNKKLCLNAYPVEPRVNINSLISMNKNALHDCCDALGISSEGTKGEIIRRIVESESTPRVINWLFCEFDQLKEAVGKQLQEIDDMLSRAESLRTELIFLQAQKDVVNMWKE